MRKLRDIALATVLGPRRVRRRSIWPARRQRTHLGRLVAVDRQGTDGGGLGTVIHRKVSANLHVLTSSMFIWIIPSALAFLAFLTWRRRGFIRNLMDVRARDRACLWGAIVVAVLGFALNDSGMAIPAMMFPVLVPYLIHLVVQPDSGPDAQAPKWLESAAGPSCERDDATHDDRRMGRRRAVRRRPGRRTEEQPLHAHRPRSRVTTG